MKISKREMNLGIITLAAVLIGFTWYVVDGKADSWKSKAVEIQKTRQQIRYFESAIRNQQNWMDELNALQQDLRIFDTELRSVAPKQLYATAQHSLLPTITPPGWPSPALPIDALPSGCKPPWR